MNIDRGRIEVWIASLEQTLQLIRELILPSRETAG
jgi:hypothetical protein